MSFIDAIVKSESLSNSSKTQYLEKLATLTKLVGNTVDYILENPSKVIPLIRRRYQAAPTQRAFVASIKALFHHNPHLKEALPDQWQEYTEYQNELSQVVTQRYMSAEPTEKERRNWVTWPDVLAKERELANLEFGSYDHLLLAMYCLIEPLRQDYGALRIIVDKSPPEGSTTNYLQIAKDGTWGNIILNSYKTSKKYGKFERPLPPTLLGIIKASLLAYPRAYLFVDEHGQPYRISNSFTQFSNRTLKRLFGKNFTVSLMRHSHISNIDFNASTPGELFAKSKNMAHSIGMQQLYRRKVDPLPPLTVTKHAATSPPAILPEQRTYGVLTDANGQRYLTLSV